MNFSIVLIARNEVKTLPKLAKSVEEFQKRGGEVVLMDTGSTDGTQDLARSFGFKITEVGEEYLHTIDKDLACKINERFVIAGEKPIVNTGDKYFDFASARNHSASLASNDWICTVDADEAFTKLDLDEIEKIIADKNLAHLEYEFVFSHDQWDNPAIQFVQSKFYNRKKMQWVGIVHEVLQPIK